MDKLKEHLVQYTKEKHLTLSKKTIKKMIKFSNSQNTAKPLIKYCNKILYINEDEWKAINAFRKEKERNLKPLGLIL